MSYSDTTTAYLRSKVMTAPPEELRLMLLDGALRFAHQARNGLEMKNYEMTFSGFSQCRAIVVELMTSMNEAAAPELTDRVKSLYAFFFSELLAASHDRDIARLDKVIELLGYERETWALLIEKLVEERGGARPAGQSAGLSLRA